MCRWMRAMWPISDIMEWQATERSEDLRETGCAESDNPIAAAEDTSGGAELEPIRAVKL
jgi:hypothetical protein